MSKGLNLKKDLKILQKTFGLLENSLYFCNPKSREVGSAEGINLD